VGMGLVGCDDGDDPYSGVAFGDGTSGVGGSARASALGIKDGNRSAPLLTGPGRPGASPHQSWPRIRSSGS
jgi:hypothetical protein